jgi:hypothetical protein
MGIVGFVGMGQDAIGQGSGHRVRYHGRTDDHRLGCSTLHLSVFDR